MRHLWLLTLVLAVGSSGCFLRVSSGVVGGIPKGATAVGTPLVDDEAVVAGWDGSFAQDGSLLVLLTDNRLIHHSDDGERVVQLLDIQTIVVDEDGGRIVVKTTGDLLILPIGSSKERLEFARLLQRAVQDRKVRGSDG